MGVLSDLEPKAVFHFFEELEQIPRGSGNTEAVKAWLLDFAKQRDLDAVSDPAGNVIIRKGGSAGYEDAPTVVLQGHMDMVAVKTQEKQHDFTKDPLDLVVEGDYISADGTSLGGDDGIAIAYMLAILDDPDLPHPPLECVITNDEEIGLLGASAIDASLLKGRVMVNLDSEEEGVFTCGCAGGASADVLLKISRTSLKGLPVQINLEDLLGGHSGNMIAENRANAISLMGRLLYELDENVAFSLESVNGGEKDNAIADSIKARLIIDPDDLPALEEKVEEFGRNVRNEYLGTDEAIRLSAVSGNMHAVRVMDPESQDRVIFLLMNIPYGVTKMNGLIPDLPETSSNPGIARTGENEFLITTGCRSSIGSARKALYNRIRSMAEITGAQFRIRGEYPEWAYRKDSPLRDKMAALYREMYGKDPVINIIHAGLECGLFYEKMPGLDAVSIGPDMQEIHTTNETLSISSSARVWNYLTRLLAELK